MFESFSPFAQISTVVDLYLTDFEQLGGMRLALLGSAHLVRLVRLTLLNSPHEMLRDRYKEVAMGLT